MLLSELLTDVLTRSGVSASDQALIEFINKKELQFEVPETLTAGTNNLISIDQAKNHPALKSHYYGASLTPVEKEIEKLFDALEFTDEQRSSILGTKSTYEKFPLLTDQIKAIIETKSKKSAGSDTAKEEINKLLETIKTMTSTHQNELKTLNDSFASEKTNDSIKSVLSGYNYTDAISRDIAIKTAHNILTESLQAKKAKIKLDNGNLTLVNSDDDSLPYFENNKPITFKDFADRSVADLLKKSGGTPPATPANPNQPPAPPTNNWLADQVSSDLASLRASKV